VRDPVVTVKRLVEHDAAVRTAAVGGDEHCIALLPSELASRIPAF